MSGVPAHASLMAQTQLWHPTAFLLLSASLLFAIWQNASLKTLYALSLVPSAADSCHSAKLPCYTELYGKSAFFL